MIGPLMKVGNLRECNIVLNFNIQSGLKRDPIPDLPALYLVEPTMQNYQLIAQDAKDKLYDMIMVFFTK